MHPAETYRRRAERAERACENARNADAKRLARTAAQRWRELAEFAQRREAEGPPIPVRFGDADEAANQRAVDADVLEVAADGGLKPVGAKTVIIATGGSGRLYAGTTNAWACTGDGSAMRSMRACR